MNNKDLSISVRSIENNKANEISQDFKFIDVSNTKVNKDNTNDMKNDINCIIKLKFKSFCLAGSGKLFAGMDSNYNLYIFN